MTKTKWAISMLGVLIACSLSVSSASALELQTFVSSTGNDANACTRSAPCRTISAAVLKTNSGGEVRMLDAVVDDGDITIDRSITIDGGNLAAINIPVVFPSWCIIVNAGVNDVVTIRNISIERSNNNGIEFLNGKRLNVENVRIDGVPQRGINIDLPAGTTSSVVIKDTIIKGKASSIGVRMSAVSGTPTLTIDHSHIQGLTTGLDVLTGRATIINSVVSHNSSFGIIAEGASTINVDNCVIWNNLTGVQAQVGTVVRLISNGIYNNTTGMSGFGTISSDGNNKNAGNTTPGAPNAGMTKH